MCTAKDNKMRWVEEDVRCSSMYNCVPGQCVASPFFFELRTIKATPSFQVASSPAEPVLAAEGSAMRASWVRHEIKGTVSRDYTGIKLVIDPNAYRGHEWLKHERFKGTPIGSWFTPWKSFNFGRNFAEMFAKIIFSSGGSYTEGRKMILRWPHVFTTFSYKPT